MNPYLFIINQHKENIGWEETNWNDREWRRTGITFGIVPKWFSEKIILGNYVIRPFFSADSWTVQWPDHILLILWFQLWQNNQWILTASATLGICIAGKFYPCMNSPNDGEWNQFNLAPIWDRRFSLSQNPDTHSLFHTHHLDRYHPESSVTGISRFSLPLPLEIQNNASIFFLSKLTRLLFVQHNPPGSWAVRNW